MMLLMMRVLFSFLLKLNSPHPYTFTSPLQQKLKQNHRASHNCYSVKKHVKALSIQMAFKQVIAWNRMIRGRVNLVICLVGSFFNFSFLISLDNGFPNFSFTGNTVLFPSTDIIMVALL